MFRKNQPKNSSPLGDNPNIKPQSLSFIKNISLILCSSSFGLQELDRCGILGMNVLTKMGLVIDLPNRTILAQGEGQEPYMVAASCRVASVKAPMEISVLQWEL